MLAHSDLKAGDACPACAAAQARGRLYSHRPGVLLRLVGHPLISGVCYQVQKLRCGLCSQIYSAEVPDEIKSAPKYAPSARSNLAIGRYYLGLPFKRIEGWQAAQGIPVPDATQWDQVNALYHDVEPVVEALASLSAQGSLYHYDDTPNRILDHSKNYQAGLTQRKGVYTTAIISRVSAYTIHLFYTSARYAGENVATLLDQREVSDPLMSMSDASRQNLPKGLKDKDLLARWVLCLVHGRRKFFELLESFPAECEFVIEEIGKIYDNERHCRLNGRDAQARLAYHQQHSAPIMNALWVWLNNQLLYEATEANSGLGQAIRYLYRHWQALTRFLHVAGAPIDNSWAERLIKVVIRHRRNSLFFKTYYGATVGDGLMSLITTAIANQENPFDYLNTLQHYASEVAQDPQVWLPWNYRARSLEKAA